MAKTYDFSPRNLAGTGLLLKPNISAGNPLPTISSVAVAGGVITIQGTNLGAAQLSGGVALVQGAASLPAAILTWSDITITATEPTIESSILSYGAANVTVTNNNSDSVASALALNVTAPREAIRIVDPIPFDANDPTSIGFVVGGANRLPITEDQFVHDPQLYIKDGAAVAFTISVRADLSYTIIGVGDLPLGDYEFRNCRAYDSVLNSWGALGVIELVSAAPSVNTAPVVTAPVDTSRSFVNGSGGLALNDTQLATLFATAVVVDDSDTLTVSPDLSAFTGLIPAGAHTIQFNSTADSDGLIGSDTMLLTVTEAAAGNSAPSITSTSTVAVTVGVSVNHTVTTNDIDGDVLTIVTVGSLPSGYTLVDNGNGTATLTIVAPGAGAQNITVRVSDGSLSDDQVITVNATAVVVVDNPPVFTSNPITSVIIGNQYSYTPTATDADGDSVVITVPVIPNWMTFSGGALSGDSTGVSPGNYSVQVNSTANDVTVSQVFTVVVSASLFTYPEDKVFRFSSKTTKHLTIGNEFEGLGVFYVQETLVYNVSSATSIKVAVVSIDTNDLYCEPVEQDSNHPGSDWANGAITIFLPKEITAQVLSSVDRVDMAKMEIEVVVNEKHYSWFVPLILRKSNIN